MAESVVGEDEVERGRRGRGRQETQDGQLRSGGRGHIRGPLGSRGRASKDELGSRRAAQDDAEDTSELGDAGGEDVDRAPFWLLALLLPMEALTSTGESDAPDEDAEEVTLSRRPIRGCVERAAGGRYEQEGSVA